MYKQSPSRNQRSKGIKVKHILQICVLVAVCFWLLYQVKHSHEKRKEFESEDGKVVEKLQNDGELQRFGRKDIPKVTDITTSVEKPEEDEDDKEDEEDKENKNEDDEAEKEDDRVGERDDERGGGDDEIDEHEPEKSEEEEVDEDKEREEKESTTKENENENEEREDTHEEGHPEEEEEEFGKDGHTESEESDDVDKEDHGEREITSDDHDHDVERNTREAQEELYRADDASSEVAHNVQSISQEKGNVTLGQANEIYGKINFGQEHETKTSEELVKPDLQPREDINITSSNATITVQNNDEVNLTKANDGSFQNSTLPEIPNNSTAVGDSFTVASLSNGTKMTFDDNLSQNDTVGIKEAMDDKNQLKAGEDANKSEDVNTYKTLASDATNDSEVIKDGKDGLVGDGSEDKKPENIGKAGTDENSESHSSEGKETIQHDPIDASDTDILTQEEKEIRTDLDTLPEIKSEVHDTEDAVAE